MTHRRRKDPACYNPLNPYMVHTSEPKIQVRICKRQMLGHTFHRSGNQNLICIELSNLRNQEILLIHRISGSFVGHMHNSTLLERNRSFVNRYNHLLCLHMGHSLGIGTRRDIYKYRSLYHMFLRFCSRCLFGIISNKDRILDNPNLRKTLSNSVGHICS